MKRKMLPVLFLILVMLVSGCSEQDENSIAVVNNESESIAIQLNEDSASCNSNAVQISGSIISIMDEGTYALSGELNDGMIIVSAEKTDTIRLILDGVTIHSEACAPIYIMQADEVFITMTEGTANTLSNGGTFTPIGGDNIDAVILSKDDITLNGSGTMTITSPAGNGIVSKDSLKITGGTYDINCASHALSGKDDISIADGVFTIVSGKDGIHAENSNDDAYGFVNIQNGTFQITAEGDCISASSYLQIEDGSFDLTAGGGSSNGAAHTSDSWGAFRGGGNHQSERNGQMGERPDNEDGTPPEGEPGNRENMWPEGETGNRENMRSEGDSEDRENMPPDRKPDDGNVPEMPVEATETEEDDGTSLKGIKAETDILINGGIFTIDSADDAVHSNATVIVNGGTFEIASGDDAFHADDILTINAGTINITESYEGLEGLHVNVSGGDIKLVASDDGLNAAGGTDASGMTGGRDGMFEEGRPSSSNGSIMISGGTISVTANGDGLDANGTLEITGGYTIVCGPTQGDTATLDYDSAGTISGGTFIGTGASGMAQSFSSSEQGVIMLRVDKLPVGTTIKLSDSEGNILLTHTPDLEYEVVILSSPDLISGQSYTVTAGSLSQEVTAD